MVTAEGLPASKQQQGPQLHWYLHVHQSSKSCWWLSKIEGEGLWDQGVGPCFELVLETEDVSWPTSAQANSSPVGHISGHGCNVARILDRDLEMVPRREWRIHGSCLEICSIVCYHCSSLSSRGSTSFQCDCQTPLHGALRHEGQGTQP